MNELLNVLKWSFLFFPFFNQRSISGLRYMTSIFTACALYTIVPR